MYRLGEYHGPLNRKLRTIPARPSKDNWTTGFVAPVEMRFVS
jgi:hypothetical protein